MGSRVKKPITTNDHGNGVTTDYEMLDSNADDADEYGLHQY
jgi:hypothetical protein